MERHRYQFEATMRDDGNVSDSIEKPNTGPVRWRIKITRTDGQVDILDCVNRQECIDIAIDTMADHDMSVDGVDHIEITPLNDQPANIGP